MPGARVGYLKFIFVKDVARESTQVIIHKVRGGDIHDNDESRCLHFSADTEQGKALLGSDSGIAAAWLTINHRLVFPGREIKDIYTFKTPNPERRDNVLFVVSVDT